MKFIRRRETARRCGDVATITVDRWADDPRYGHLNFPKKVRLGANSVGFVEEEIDAWLEARAAERDDVEASVAARAHERDDIDADGNDAEGEDDDGDGDDAEAA